MQCTVDETHPIPLYDDAAFINIIEALRVLAKEDYEDFTPLRAFRTYSYPQPVVTLTSPLQKPIKTKYVIWGLLLAWAWLSHPGHAVVTHFILSWDDHLVGGIMFGSADPAAQGNDGKFNGIATRALAKDHGLEAPMEGYSDLRRYSDADLVVSFNYFGTDGLMTKENMQKSLLYVLSQLARYPVDALVPDNWRPRVQDEYCLFVAQKIVSSSPWSFDFFWLIEATAVAANYLLRRHSYRNLNGLILVDGHVIGNLMLFSRLRSKEASPSDVEAF